MEPLTEEKKKLTEEEKKARQRGYVRQNYYRKLKQLQELRDEVDKLKGQLMEAQWKRDYDAKFSNEGKKQMLVEAMDKNARLRKRLEAENDLLKQRLSEHEALAAKMEQFLREFEEDRVLYVHMGFAGPVLTFNPFSFELLVWLQDDISSLSDAQLLVRPMTRDECQAIARVSEEEIMDFLVSHAYVSTGAKVFGWSDRRKEEGRQLKFALQKVFSGNTDAIASRNWALTKSTKHVAALHSASMNAQYRVVQKIDEDNVLMLRVLNITAHQTVAKSLVLMTRWRTEKGWLITHRSIAHERLVPQAMEILGLDHLNRAPRQGWNENFTWILFQETGDGICTVDYGGTVPLLIVYSPEAFLLEALFVVLRWETQVNGPIFSLAQ